MATSTDVLSGVATTDTKDLTTTVPLTINGTTLNLAPTKTDSGAIKDLLNLEATELEYDAQAKGQEKSAEGYRKESEAYDTSALAADEAARLSRVSGHLKDFQEQSTIYKTLSGQQADVASAGFGSGGSALYLMRSSAYQGALERQAIGTTTAINEAGYAGEASASRAQSAAALVAADAADELATAYSSSATKAKTNATNYAQYLIDSEKALDSETTGTSTSSTSSSKTSTTGTSLRERMYDDRGLNVMTGETMTKQAYNFTVVSKDSKGKYQIGTGEDADKKLGGTLDL